MLVDTGPLGPLASQRDKARCTGLSEGLSRALADDLGCAHRVFPPRTQLLPHCPLSVDRTRRLEILSLGRDELVSAIGWITVTPTAR